MALRKIICAVLLIVVMAGSAGCQALSLGEESLPEDTIEEFEDAVNAMDVNGMLDCMDESTVKTLTAGMDLMMQIAGAAAGVDLGLSGEDLIALFPLFQELIGEEMYANGYPQVDFQVQETYIKGDRATVYFTEANSGETEVINMKKEDGKWYMTLSTQVIAQEDADRVIIAGQEEASSEHDSAGILGIGDLGDEFSIEQFLSKLLPQLPDIFDQEKLVKFLKGLYSQGEDTAVCEVDGDGVIHLSGFPGNGAAVLSEYKIGSYYPNSYSVTIDGKQVYLGGAQCIGFARYVQYKMYGSSDYDDTEHFQVVSGSEDLSGTQVTDGDTFKNLLMEAGAGAHIRTRTDGGTNPHSLIVTEVTDEGFSYIDANGDGKGTVRKGTFTWEEYKNGYGKRGLQYIKVYQETSE